MDEGNANAKTYNERVSWKLKASAVELVEEEIYDPPFSFPKGNYSYFLTKKKFMAPLYPEDSDLWN